MKNWPKVQRSVLESVVPVWADLKSWLFWILASFFFHGRVGKEFQVDRLIFSFDAVVWNPFLMKTTFTSDLSWFVSNIWEHLFCINHF